MKTNTDSIPDAYREFRGMYDWYTRILCIYNNNDVSSGIILYSSHLAYIEVAGVKINLTNNRTNVLFRRSDKLLRTYCYTVRYKYTIRRMIPIYAMI